MPAIKRKVFGLTKHEKDFYVDTRMNIALEFFAGEEREADGFALMSWRSARLAASALARKAVVSARQENDGYPVEAFDYFHEQDCSCARCRAIRADLA